MTPRIFCTPSSSILFLNQHLNETLLKHLWSKSWKNCVYLCYIWIIFSTMIKQMASISTPKLAQSFVTSWTNISLSNIRQFSFICCYLLMIALCSMHLLAHEIACLCIFLMCFWPGHSGRIQEMFNGIPECITVRARKPRKFHVWRGKS